MGVGDRHFWGGSQIKQDTVNGKHLSLKGMLLPPAYQKNRLRLHFTREVMIYKC